MTSLSRIIRVLAVVLCLVSAAALRAQQTAPGANAPNAAPEFEPQAKAAIIRLDADVDDVMLKSIKRRVDIAAKAGCTIVIFEVDTFGGNGRSAIEISKFIKSIPAIYKMQTAAWVHDKAYSAGAMISVACRHIVMASNGTLGLCAPIVLATNRLTGEQELVPLPETERAKISDPVKQEFDDSARQNGYDQTILEAMVLMPIEIHEMLNTRTGQTRFVDTDVKAKLLAEEADLPGGAKEHPWQYRRTVDDAKQILTVGAQDAQKMKLSSATVDTQPQLVAALNVRGDVLLLEFNWAERATVFLTEWLVRLFLFVGMLVFAWLEFSHPGFSVFGIAALICLVLLVGAPFLTGIAQVWEIIFIVVGLAIIIADVLIFGGIGLLAVPGFILMAVGLVSSFIPPDPSGHYFGSQASWAAAERGLAVLVVGTFLAFGAFYFFAKYLYLTPGFNRLQLAPAGTRRPGSTSGEPEVRDAADRPAGDAVFVGAIGRAASDLRPAGKARFGDHLIPVVSYGSFIPSDTEITVIEISDMSIVVKPHTVAPAPPAPPTPAPESEPPSENPPQSFP